ncbi:hypothetical protein, partial [Teichococcus coralli]|uniref:hypothetical protein n=1 Tax=Teichococcus coralli TaxID=2545983 RepID=UPI001925374D
ATIIEVEGDREVIVTATASESGFSNALGFRVVEADGTRGADQIVFANDDTVTDGERFSLGSFADGTKLEFFILQDGGALLTGDAQAKLEATASGFLVGFEDLVAAAAQNPRHLQRDGDFNDVVFNVSFEATGSA